ncbi:ATP-binding protein [Parafannyhessea umbonata]|uniref:ATP-binding protein n=2 Tax=Parafannyhessea umbonata TaxID=604330 RepID=UPI0026EF6AC4|nr:ATP-binding protein [Parafannyhessea umbonata]MDD7199337.1 ATP-binding protein [Parafannyhessea umbonata]
MSDSAERVTPDPSRLLEGLRDTGYNFNTAISDIVDNSIAAGATNIAILAEQLYGGDIRVSIADNGCGMNHDELKNAMTYGARPREDVHSLGKFGLGLKTASTSCCKRLKVISRDSTSSQLNCAIWDLDYIAQVKDWLLKFGEPDSDDENELEAVAKNHSGTIVVWEKCDRLLSARYTNPATKAYHEAFERSLKELRQHLAMVYQRFLDSSDSRADNVRMTLNGDSVEPWNPFCTEIDGPLATNEFTVSRDGSGATGDVLVRCFVVPPKAELHSLEERQRVMPSEKNPDLRGFSEESLSGFYIYRENRLIDWGDWFNMPGIDFHSKLCRFELSFGAELDDFFQVDIKKSRIILNDALRKQLLQYVSPIVKEGIKRYRGTERKAAKTGAKQLHSDSIATIDDQEGKLTRHRLEQDGQGRVVVTNNHGTTITGYSADKEGPIFDVVDQLNDGILWEPALIQGKNGVKVNGGHEFYQRFYGLNRDIPNAVAGLDYLFWALAEAETEALDPSVQETLSDFRYETSRYLRSFARTMPDVSVEDQGGDES